MSPVRAFGRVLTVRKRRGERILMRPRQANIHMRPVPGCSGMGTSRFPCAPRSHEVAGRTRSNAKPRRKPAQPQRHLHSSDITSQGKHQIGAACAQRCLLSVRMASVQCFQVASQRPTGRLFGRRSAALASTSRGRCNRAASTFSRGDQQSPILGDRGF